MTFPELVDLLKTGGPYSALLIVMVVARHLYNARERDKEKHDVEKQALNERIIKVIESQNDALARAVDNQQHQSASLTRAVENQQLLLEAIKAVQPRLRGKE